MPDSALPSDPSAPSVPVNPTDPSAPVNPTDPSAPRREGTARAPRRAHGRRYGHPIEYEPHGGHSASKLNWLRAGVLGANDGIVSTAGLVVGVAAVDPTGTAAIFTAGVAGLVSGASSMALGEYVSVSTQRDTERALIAQESSELAHMPASEYDELVGLYLTKGLTEPTARAVATELTHHDALGAHLDIELGIDPHQLTSPWQAAASSAVSFTVGALLPIAAILLTPGGPARIPVAFAVVLFALALTGAVSARVGGAPLRTAVTRVVIGGALAMAVTWFVGRLLGFQVG